jgi:hypothetical protein
MNTPSPKYDKGKARWSLLPWVAVREVVRVLTWAATPKSEGGNGYPAHGWKTVENAEERYRDALHRHLVDREQGEMYDDASGLLSMAHAGCCVLFLLAFDVMNYPTRKTDPLPEEKTEPFSALDRVYRVARSTFVPDLVELGVRKFITHTEGWERMDEATIQRKMVSLA